jgi:hypothetical protein
MFIGLALVLADLIEPGNVVPPIGSALLTETGVDILLEDSLTGYLTLEIANG